MEITKNYPDNHLYHRYQGQTQPQPTYLEFDPATRELSADSDGSIGGGVPFSVWHGVIRRYPLPSAYLTATAIRSLMDEIADDLAVVAEGHTVEWDGSNNVGRLTDEAAEAEERIAAALDCRVDEDDTILVMDADEWYSEAKAEILDKIRGGLSAEDALAWAWEEYGDYGYHRPVVLERVDEYAEELEDR